MQKIDGEEEFQASLNTPIVNIDELVDTWIKIGCYRETDRLDRMVRVFRKALTLALYEGLHERLRDELVSLHDRKGTLTAHWKSSSPLDLCRFVDEAWESENEVGAEHDYEPDSDAVLFAELQRIANEKFDGHFTVMKFTTNWRVCFETPMECGFDIESDIQQMHVGSTFAEAAQKAIREIEPTWEVDD